MQLPDWPAYCDEELAIARDVLASGRVNYWTGEHGSAFEREFADYCGVAHGVATANGSVGLGAALRALGIGPGHEVVVSPRSFFASAAEIVLTGAVPVFADVDPDSQNITADTVRRVLSGKTRAIVCVHLAGWPCDMPALCELGAAHDLAIIEDCAQAHGAAIDGKQVGSWGDIGVFSFCQDKIMTTGGEGGMVVTDSDALWERLWAYKDHGKSFREVNRENPEPGFRWLHESFGTNLRLTELQAALGRFQLRRLDEWVDVRRRNGALLAEAFHEIECIRVPAPPDNVRHSYYKFYAFVRPEKLANGWNRDRIIAEFSGQGIPGLSGSCPEIYLEKAFADSESVPHERLPVARALGETSIMFPVHPTLDQSHMDHLARIAASVLRRAQSG
jgi:dTDP-4-amino-4,6-dideoxygalactose transaminase